MDSKTERSSEVKERKFQRLKNSLSALRLELPPEIVNDVIENVIPYVIELREEITRLKAELQQKDEEINLREAQQDVMAADTVRLLDQIEYQNKIAKDDHDKIKKLEFELKQEREEITLKAELERERELRKELVEDVKNKTITEVLDLLPKYQNAFILENDYAYLKLDISRKRTA